MHERGQESGRGEGARATGNERTKTGTDTMKEHRYDQGNEQEGIWDIAGGYDRSGCGMSE